MDAEIGAEPVPSIERGDISYTSMDVRSPKEGAYEMSEGSLHILTFRRPQYNDCNCHNLFRAPLALFKRPLVPKDIQ